MPSPRDERLFRDVAGLAAPHDRGARGPGNHQLYVHYGTAQFTAPARRVVAEAVADQVALVGLRVRRGSSAYTGAAPGRGGRCSLTQVLRTQVRRRVNVTLSIASGP